MLSLSIYVTVHELLLCYLVLYLGYAIALQIHKCKIENNIITTLQGCGIYNFST